MLSDAASLRCRVVAPGRKIRENETNDRTNQGEVTVGQANGRANAALLAETPAQDGRPGAVYRSAGDRFLLVEFGPMELDLTLNFRVLGLNQALKDAGIGGVIETIPALRSILIHYDSTVLRPSDLIAEVDRHYASLPPVEDLTIPSREISLPLAVNDQWTRADIAKYVQFIRKDAPNIRNGNNIDYAAEYNGLRDAEEFVEYLMATPVVERRQRLLPRLAVHVPARSALRGGDPEVQPDPALDAGGSRRHRRAMPGDLPGSLAGRVSAHRAHDPDLRRAAAQPGLQGRIRS